MASTHTCSAEIPIGYNCTDTACFNDAEVPYGSKEESSYSDITVIVADLSDVPAFAYNSATNSVPYPANGFTIKDVHGNVKA